MKRIIWLFALTYCVTTTVDAVEVLRWERLPLSVRLVVGQERVLFVDRNVRIGLPSSLGDRFSAQTAGGAVYLLAHAPIERSRIQLKDAETGALVLLDVTANAATEDQAPLVPVRIVVDPHDARADEHGRTIADSTHRADRTPLPVILTRYAAQSLYAPLRTIEPVDGMVPAPIPPHLALDTLLPLLPVKASILATWQLRDHWIAAIKLTNTGVSGLTLDPRTLQGDFVTAAFQHPDLGPAGDSTDTTVLYLVTRGHGLADALLPRVAPIDASANLSQTGHEDARHEK